MCISKKLIDTVHYNIVYDKALRKVVGDLQTLGLKIERNDPEEGIIIAQCVCLIIKEFLWRLYGDKIQIQVNRIDDNCSEIKFYAIPNWFRIKVNKDEKLHDLNLY